ncbi:MAG: PQQ-dependent sugar dehydrogenase [Coriobacteriia bacterium]
MALHGNRTSVTLALATLLVLAGCQDESSRPRVVAPPAESEESTAAGEPERVVTPLAEIAIALEPVATGFDQPLFATGAGDGSGRLFVVEKGGRVWVLRDGTRDPEPFLDVSGRVSRGSEQGLLGLAFPPDFVRSQVCYVNYTDRDGTSVISRFRVSGDAAEAASEQVLLTVEQPFANHNGGMLAFGPDGYLYVGFGDGGSGGDPQGNGQDLGALLGKMLRLDVSDTSSAGYAVPEDNPFVTEPGVRPEIWAFGLRNPWRYSFDRETGDLWIGDVGQNAWEEIDFQPADSEGGENYGWNLYEGAHTYPGGEEAPSVEGFTMPLVEYDRDAGKSVTGGYVYRGNEQEPLWGTYFYADFVDGRIWGLQRDRGGAAETRLLIDTGMRVSSFGEDDRGELYVIDFAGGLHRVVAD